jgi:predicted nucleic acid-binding protein
VIILDTTVLVYAVGQDHPLVEPCRTLLEAIADGRVRAVTTAEVIQEFVHVRGRRGTGSRREAAQLGRAYAELLSPLMTVEEEDLERGLELFEAHERLGAFGAVLAASAIGRGAAALVSADAAFGDVSGLLHVDPKEANLGLLWRSLE